MDVEKNAFNKNSIEIEPPNISPAPRQSVDLTHDFEIQTPVYRAYSQRSSDGSASQGSKYKHGWLKSPANFYRQYRKWILLTAVILLVILFFVMIFIYFHLSPNEISTPYDEHLNHTRTENEFIHEKTTSPSVMKAN